MTFLSIFAALLFMTTALPWLAIFAEGLLK